MLNCLIVSSDLRSVQYIINNILMNNSKVRLYNIASSIYKAINVLKINSNNIDIIILDIKTNKVTKFLYLLENLNKKQYIDSVIILTANNSKLYFNNCKHKYLQLNKSNSEIIINSIDNLVKNKTNKNISKNIVINYLNQLGYNFSNLGTKYLLEILLMLLNGNIAKSPKLKTLYSMIAKKYNTNSHNIKCVITLATKNMNKNCKLKIKKSFLPYIDSNYIYTKTVIKYFLLNYIHKD